jgi:hypothetical protein
MKYIRSFIFLFTALPILLGMGSLQGPSSPDKIPIPAKKFNVTVVDQMDVLTECADVSEGKRGKGNYTISCDNIDQIFFLLKGKSFIGSVKLHDGGLAELTLNKNNKVYGRTKNGTYPKVDV